jgi:hypothetical protein
MTTDQTAASDGGRAGPLPFDTSKAHQARVYDHLLGGQDNYAADRAAAEEMLKAYPDTAFTARANRAFLGRAVRYLAGEAGIRQFLDLGTGIPTAGNTHQVAQAIAPESRVVYVDYDPVVLAHARALLISNDAGATAYIDADARNTGTILSQAAELLDFSQPVAVTMLAVLHVIPDSDDPYAIVAKLMDAVPSGSYLAISHSGTDLFEPGVNDTFKGVMNQLIQQRYTPRSRAQVTRFFAGMDLVEPGLTAVEAWRPEPGTDTAGSSFTYGGVAGKR